MHVNPHVSLNEKVHSNNKSNSVMTLDHSLWTHSASFRTLCDLSIYTSSFCYTSLQSMKGNHIPWWLNLFEALLVQNQNPNPNYNTHNNRGRVHFLYEQGGRSWPSRLPTALSHSQPSTCHHGPCPFTDHVVLYYSSPSPRAHKFGGGINPNCGLLGLVTMTTKSGFSSPVGRKFVVIFLITILDPVCRWG